MAFKYYTQLAELEISKTKSEAERQIIHACRESVAVGNDYPCLESLTGANDRGNGYVLLRQCLELMKERGMNVFASYTYKIADCGLNRVLTDMGCEKTASCQLYDSFDDRHFGWLWRMV